MVVLKQSACRLLEATCAALSRHGPGGLRGPWGAGRLLREAGEQRGLGGGALGGRGPWEQRGLGGGALGGRGALGAADLQYAGPGDAVQAAPLPRRCLAGPGM